MRPSLRLRVRLIGAGLALAASAETSVRAQTPQPLQRAIPEATLDGKPVRLGPGARIRDESNTIRPPSTVEGERRVAYQRGLMGEIVQVWLLTDDEWRTISARIAAARRAAPPR
jgi:hypothetical protein